MEVLMLIGRYAGEIRDIYAPYARERIAAGEALDPNEIMTGGEVSATPAMLVGERGSLPLLIPAHLKQVAENLPQPKGRRRQ